MEILRYIPKLVLYILISTMIISCVKDDTAGGNSGQDAMVTIVINSPGDDVSTRAVSTEQQNEVKNIDILLFRPDGGKFYDNIRCNTIITDNNNSRLKNFTVRLPVGDFDMVILANARAMVDEADFTDKTKEAALQNLVKGHPLAAPFPLWGDVGKLTIQQDLQFTTPVELLRMVAKVDLQLSGAALNNFRITSVDIYNHTSQGTLVPRSDQLASDGGGKKIVTLPNIPTSAATIATPLSYTVSAAGETSYKNEVFLFECRNLDGSNPRPFAERTCVVVGGIWDKNGNGDFSDDGAPTYYRADFSQANGGAEKHYDILRNHNYTINISKVDGLGEETSEEAFKNTPVNMTTEVLTWDLCQQEDMFDGQYYISITPKKSHFWAGGGKVTINVKSNADFKAWAVANPENNPPAYAPWVIPTEDSPKWNSNITCDSINGVDFECIIAPNNETGSSDRTAYIQFRRAGSPVALVATIHQDGLALAPLKRTANCFMISPDNLMTFRIPIWSQVSKAIKGYGGVAGNTPDADAVLPQDWLDRNTVYNTPRFAATILWSDKPIDPDSDQTVIRDVFLADCDSNEDLTGNTSASIIVRPGALEGNTVVALFLDENGDGIYNPADGDQIKWTWHIWSTRYWPYSNSIEDINVSKPTSVSQNGLVVMTNGVVYRHKAKNRSNVFMDRNLGATDMALGGDKLVYESDNFLGTYGLYYQWGRKDPFIGPKSITSAESAPVYYPETSKARLVSNALVTVNNNFVNSVANPLTFYSNTNVYNTYDWYAVCDDPGNYRDRQNDNLWGSSGYTNDQGKSAFDPCPNGWRVPASGYTAYYDFTYSPILFPDGTYNAPIDINEYTDAEFTYGYNFYIRSSPYCLGWYPAAGRRRGSVSLPGVFNRTGATGIYWTATATEDGQVSNFSAVSFDLATGFITPAARADRADGAPIRCVKE